jgi:hypothetical protein
LSTSDRETKRGDEGVVRIIMPYVAKTATSETTIIIIDVLGEHGADWKTALVSKLKEGR